MTNWLRNISIAVFLLMLFVSFEVVSAANILDVKSLYDRTVVEGEELSFSVYLETEDNDFNLSFFDASDGTYDFLPATNNAVLVPTSDHTEHVFTWTPQVGWKGDYLLRFEVADTEEDFSTYEDVEITVSGVDHQPVALLMNDIDVVYGEEVSFSVPYTHLDINEQVRFTLVSMYRTMPEGVEFNENNGRFVWYPDSVNSDVDKYTFNYCVYDDDTGDCEMIDIYVSDNHLPELFLDPPGNRSLYEGETLKIVLSGDDYEDDYDLDFYAYQLLIEGAGEEEVVKKIDLPLWAEFNGKTFEWSPKSSQVGIYHIRFKVEDNDDGFTNTDITVEVLAEDVVEVDEGVVDVDGGEDVGEDDFDGFSDIDESSDYYEAANYVGKLGIFEGDDGDGIFDLDRSITRVETAKVVVEALGYSLTAVTEADPYLGFSDLDLDEWYMPYVYKAYSLGIMTGYNGIEMRPEQIVNRVEMLRIFLDAVKVEIPFCVEDVYLDVKKDDWFCGYVMYARDNALIEILPNEGFNPGSGMKRSDVAQLLYLWSL